MIQQSQHTPREVFKIFHRLVNPGILGDYNGCEIYNFTFYKANNSGHSMNLYTLVRFGSFQTSEFRQSPRFISDRFNIQIGNENFTFGIYHFKKELLEFARFYSKFLRNGNWNLSGSTLHQGTNKVIPKQFVPSDGTFGPALNKVLKNNFFNGSYIIEHFDETKKEVIPLFEASEKLVELSEKMEKNVPIQIGSVSDRLGNIILQFPIEVIRSTFSSSADSKSVEVNSKFFQDFPDIS